MVTVSVADGRLLVRLTGWDVVWALKRSVAVPVSHVVGARVAERRTLHPEWLRVPGTYLPWVLVAGTYRRRGHRSFWCVHRAKEVVVIDLQAEKYDRLVLQVGDPRSTVAQVANSV